MNVSPQAAIATIRINLLRRPLWPIEMAEECLDVGRQKLLAMIEGGTLAWVFNLSPSVKRQELRILGHSVIEQQFGPISGIGKTKSLGLPEVLKLILPHVRLAVRGVELQRLFACGPDLVRALHQADEIERLPGELPRQGINSSPRFTRASVEKFLERKRIT